MELTSHKVHPDRIRRVAEGSCGTVPRRAGGEAQAAGVAGCGRVPAALWVAAGTGGRRLLPELPSLATPAGERRALGPFAERPARPLRARLAARAGAGARRGAPDRNRPGPRRARRRRTAARDRQALSDRLPARPRASRAAALRAG